MQKPAALPCLTSTDGNKSEIIPRIFHLEGITPQKNIYIDI